MELGVAPGWIRSASFSNSRSGHDVRHGGGARRTRAQLTFTDIDGHRFQVFITDLPDDDIAYLEALQRGRGRAEKLICNLKDTGVENLPSRMICLDGDLARAEPKKLRYCLLHAAGIVARTGRRTRLRIAETWP